MPRIVPTRGLSSAVTAMKVKAFDVPSSNQQGILLIYVTEGHTGRECPKPRDYSRVTCQNCGEKGHTKVRCKQPPKEEDGEGFGSGNAGQGGADAAGGYGASNDWESHAMGADSGYVAPEVAVGSTVNGMW